MRHIWIEPKYSTPTGLREFRCEHCGETVKITRIQARNEHGELVMQYPLAFEGCMGDPKVLPRLRRERAI